MVDGVSGKTVLMSDTLARFKAAKANIVTAVSNDPEEKLSGLLSLDPKLQAKLQTGRKVNAYLQIFSSALKWINGGKDITVLNKYLDGIESGKSDNNFKIDKKV